MPIKEGRAGYLTSLLKQSVGVTAFDKTSAYLTEKGEHPLVGDLGGGIAAATAVIAPAYARSYEENSQNNPLYDTSQILKIDITNFIATTALSKFGILGMALLERTVGIDNPELLPYTVINSLVVGKFLANMYTNHRLNRLQNSYLNPPQSSN